MASMQLRGSSTKGCLFGVPGHVPGRQYEQAQRGLCPAGMVICGGADAGGVELHTNREWKGIVFQLWPTPESERFACEVYGSPE